MEAAPPKIAEALLDKVNAFNLSTGAKGILLTGAFALTALLDPLAT